jgi:imidazolonepropionase-like amidohydrolase
MSRNGVLHLRGPVLIGPDDVRGEAWVVGDRVSFTPPTGPADVTTIDGWVLPGLVDAHCHVGLGAGGAVSLAETEQQALTDRDAGTLLIRDAGSPVDTTWVNARVDLPVVIRAGRHVARTARYLRNFAEEVEPEDLAEAVSRQAAIGDGWVKIVGDWIDRAVGDLTPCWPDDAARAAIDAAHSLGARVTAHCFGEDAVSQLVEAGIDCIEHGTGLTPQSVPVLAQRGVAVVPTLVNIATFPTIAAAAEAKFPRYAAHMRDLHARRYETVRAAHDAGIPLYAGTDAGGSLPHGLIASEILELAAAGLSPTEALAAAAWNARAWLGKDGLTEGAQADLVVCEMDPREDLRTLLSPLGVVLRGEVMAGR